MRLALPGSRPKTTLCLEYTACGSLYGRGHYGLKGEDIPLESRIIAVADTFSALRTYRVYRPALSISETVKILKAARGPQLDEEIVDCFLTLNLDFWEALECNCEICRQRRAALETVRQEAAGQIAPHQATRAAQ